MSAITYLHLFYEDANEGIFGMRHSCIRHGKNFIALLGLVSMMVGCASTPKDHETFMAEGFRIAVPETGTRVMVRGNHSGAVNQAITWLNNHQFLVVNRWVEKGSTAPGGDLRDRKELETQVLAAAHKVDATLVVFAHVEDTPVKYTVDPVSVGHKPKNMIAVNIQGINANTGEVMFGAKAWNSEPVVPSERVVEDLTTFALEKAWQSPEGSRSIQQEVTPEIKTEQKPPLVSPVPVEPTETPTVAQAVEVESAATSPEQVTVNKEPIPEDKPPSPVAAQPAAAEHSETSENPSLGLQIASSALSILYTPFKVVYAGLGGIFGGFAYVLSGGNEEVAHSVWDASLGGTYWLTPDHLQGNEPVRFFGVPPN